MSDDIVARVRVWSDWLNERCPDTEVQNDLRAAADEIERLRVIVQGWERSARNAERDIAELRDRVRKFEERCSAAAFLLQVPILEDTDGRG